jgi:hypothetical protein
MIDLELISAARTNWKKVLGLASAMELEDPPARAE